MADKALNRNERKASDREVTALTGLLPCPFCGSAVLEFVFKVHPRCTSCGCVQEKIKGFAAVKAWNNRVGRIPTDAAENITVDGCIEEIGPI